MITDPYFWVGLGAGLFIGINLGVVVMAAFVAAARNNS